ncbi:MAG: hypothetical protein KDA79_22860 [Planctomycetaceae bacterium]|nr:hypothetical protein [Planctomycetaceae bacterium]
MYQVLKVAVVTALLTGCGGASGPEQVLVSGKVTWQGEPVEDGVIRFLPAEGSDTPTKSAVVQKGQYEASGRGALVPGTYRVEITAFTGGPAGPSLPVSDPESAKREQEAQTRKQILPEKYNAKSEIEPFVVPSGAGEIEKNFELE